MAGVDRSGYTVTKQKPPNDHGQTTWRVNRDSDGAGLGAFHDDEGIDAAIQGDRADRQHTGDTAKPKSTARKRTSAKSSSKA